MGWVGGFKVLISGGIILCWFSCWVDHCLRWRATAIGGGRDVIGVEEEKCVSRANYVNMHLLLIASIGFSIYLVWGAKC